MYRSGVVLLSGIILFLPLSTAGNSLMVVDAKQRVIGLYGGACGPSSPQTEYSVFTAFGYYACLNPYRPSYPTVDQVTAPFTPDLIGGIAFLTPDCSGQAFFYASGPPSGGGPVPFSGGFVSWPGSYFGYGASPRDGSVSQVLAFKSTQPNFGQGACSPTSLNAQALPAFQNDIAVTGISNSEYAIPLTIAELPDSMISDEIFFDGFDD